MNQKLCTVTEGQRLKTPQYTLFCTWKTSCCCGAGHIDNLEFSFL